ncbi:MAG: hypothetical protein O2949_09275, partial [Proteobacteria bacterium]|nr:hypothetical protein [Pseudomonadota bacterium]
RRRVWKGYPINFGFEQAVRCCRAGVGTAAEGYQLVGLPRGPVLSACWRVLAPSLNSLAMILWNVGKKN